MKTRIPFVVQFSLMLTTVLGNQATSLSNHLFNCQQAVGLYTFSMQAVVMLHLI